MHKEVVVHIHNGVLLSHKRDTFESVLMRWMNLESIIQSEDEAGGQASLISWHNYIGIPINFHEESGIVTF